MCKISMSCDNCAMTCQMPHEWCCLTICGEVESCRNCNKGIYLEKENKNNENN